MKVLITGHRGYIGAAILPLFVQAGHEVTGLDTAYFDGCDFGEASFRHPEILKDIRDVSARDLEGFDAIVHLAALCNDQLGQLNENLTYEINHRASIQLAVEAKRSGVRRFLFSSSCSMYGAAGEDFLDEKAEFRPVTAYAKSKVLVERDLAGLASASFFSVSLRNATAYGASPRLRLDIVLNDLVASAVTTGRILMQSDGTPWRPIVHAEDIGRAFLAALTAPESAVANRAFNVGLTEENYQIRDLAEIVRETVPSCRIEYAPGAGPDLRCYRVSFERIRTGLPGFEPRWNARLGARQMYEFFMRHGLSREDYGGPKFRRVQHIRGMLHSRLLDERLRWSGQPAVPEPNTEAAPLSAS